MRWFGPVLVLLGLLLLACDEDLEDVTATPTTIPGSVSGSDVTHSDRYGSAVALTADRMAVGIPGDDNAAPEAGAVLLYARTEVAFTEETRVTRPEGDAGWGDRFGAAVAISGDLLYVGAPGIDGIGPDVGAVYVFDIGGTSFAPVATLTSPAPFANQEFGSSVSALGDIIAIGAAGADLDSRDVGTVVVFRRVGDQYAVAEDATAQ